MSKSTKNWKSNYNVYAKCTNMYFLVELYILQENEVLIFAYNYIPLSSFFKKKTAHNTKP